MQLHHLLDVLLGAPLTSLDTKLPLEPGICPWKPSVEGPSASFLNVMQFMDSVSFVSGVRVDSSSEGQNSEDEKEEMHGEQLQRGANPAYDDPAGQPLRRGRGRPRKHPKPTSTSNGRSKTGCIPCKRSHKKCGEEKPVCNKCKYSGKVCEYPTPPLKRTLATGVNRPKKANRQQWKKPNVSAIRPPSPPPISDLPPLWAGLNTPLDREFFRHFCVMKMLPLPSLETNSNPWSQIILPIALENEASMHAILFLSALHKMQLEPDSLVQERAREHLDDLLRLMSRDDRIKGDVRGSRQSNNDDLVAQTLILHLCKDFNPPSEDYDPNCHFRQLQQFLDRQSISNPDFERFIREFLQTTELPDSAAPLYYQESYMSNLPPFYNGTTAQYIGTQNNFAALLSRVNSIRDRFRERRRRDPAAALDAEDVLEALDLDEVLKDWRYSSANGLRLPGKASLDDQSRYNFELLVRECIWIYLYDTTNRSKPGPDLARSVNQGIEYLDGLIRTAGFANSLDQQLALFEEQKTATNGSLDGSEGTVLSMPLLILGCTAFESTQRDRIEWSFQQIQTLWDSNVCARTQHFARDIWRVMDQCEPGSWDWQELWRQRHATLFWQHTHAK